MTHAEPVIEQVRVRVLPDGRMSRRDTATYIGTAEKTLAMWQLEGKGPPSVLVGGRRFYFKDDVDAFIRGKPARASDRDPDEASERVAEEVVARTEIDNLADQTPEPKRRE